MKRLLITRDDIAPAATFALATLGAQTLNISQAAILAGIVTYTFTQATGGGQNPGPGMVIIITGMADAGNNGTFTIITGASTTFTVSNASGVNRSAQTGTGTLSNKGRDATGEGIKSLTGFFDSDTTSLAPNWGSWSFGAGYVGNPYSHSWDMEGVDVPVTYSVLSGSLPTGLVLNNVGDAQGSITGTPTTAGTYSFTLRAVNVSGTTDKSFSITISNAAGGGGAWVSVS